MKKRTLNQTWTLCLRMWKWVARNWKPGMNISALKAAWIKVNSPIDEIIWGHCYFCDISSGICSTCPGKLVDSNFGCGNHEYASDENPPAFYKELLRLNRIRKASKLKRTMEVT